VKITLIGPLRLRVDYRVFKLEATRCIRRRTAFTWD
jgi:hypothetical protein